MSNDIFIPSMGESINEATIGKLLKQTGDIVEADEEVLEIETAKVNQLIYAPVRGVIAFTVKTGDVVKVGARVAIIQPVEAKSVIAPKTSPAKTAPPEPRASVAQIQKQEWMKETLKNPVAISSGTTPTGHREKMSSIRKAIAARLVQVSRETAMVTTFAEVDMSAIIEMREKYKDAFLKKFSTKLGFSSFFVTAAADALQAFEQVNSYIDGDDLVYRGSIDISVAVSSDKGLFVPVLKNADMMSYAEIEQKIDDFAVKAKEGKITIDDLTGGGFTITNGGIFGSLLSTPLINPPQCAILGMHKIEKRPVVVNDQIVIRSMMYLALSYDHRILDGKEAVQFLIHIKNHLEDPKSKIVGI